MKKNHISIVSLFSYFLFCGNLFGQSFSVVPKNVYSSSSNQLGNFSTSNDCSGTDPKFLKVIVKPACYGANLRGGGSSLDPKGAPVKMALNISNSGTIFGSEVTFPTKVVWPENYGQTCTWKKNGGNHSIQCNIDGTNVPYTCSYDNAKWFLDDTLKCNRIGDPKDQAGLNKSISCLFFYTWKGTGYAATQSYSKKTGYANCGLTDENENLAGSIVVNNSKSVGSIDKFGKRGEVVVTYKDADIKKINVTQDMTTGEYNTSGARSNISVSFMQGKKKLTYKLEKGMDEFEQCLTIKPSFLGTNQFCGSYYSPLMFFFDKKRPLFIGQSSFPLHHDSLITNWVERNSPGYFLALDKNKDGIINSSKELFGDNHSFANGFENLKSFDDNFDYKIDKNDKVFSSLILWKDTNGDGISQKGEMESLNTHSISSISVHYKKGSKNYGSRAEVREIGNFTYVAQGEEVKGDVLDIWFSPKN